MVDQREAMWCCIDRKHTAKIEELEREEELREFLKMRQYRKLTYNPFEVLKK